jgi:hydrogenase nickel incorporation protein HypA/HybF
MHELGISERIVAICTEHAAAQGPRTRVTQVTLEIGALSAVLPDALRFCFEVCTNGTIVAGAALEIIEIAGRARCIDCACEFSVSEIYGSCRCGSANLALIAGDELRVKQMEVEQCA